MSVAEILGYASGVIIVVFFVVRHLISYSIQKTEELEREKEKANTRALSRLDDQTKNFRMAVFTLESEIKELSAQLSGNSSDIKVLREQLRQTEKHIDRYTDTADDRVRNIIKSEVTNLTKQLMLIKKKKQDGQ